MSLFVNEKSIEYSFSLLFAYLLFIMIMRGAKYFAYQKYTAQEISIDVFHLKISLKFNSVRLLNNNNVLARLLL